MVNREHLIKVIISRFAEADEFPMVDLESLDNQELSYLAFKDDSDLEGYE